MSALGGSNKNELMFGSGEVTVDETTNKASIIYPEAVYSYNSAPTGIKLTIDISVNTGVLEIRYLTELSPEGESLPLLTFLSNGGFTAGDDEVLTAPMWSGGTYWEDPNSNSILSGGVRVGYPGENDQSLESGYVDLYASDGSGGVGIAYINTPRMAMEFAIKTGENGVQFSPVLFELKQILGKSVPLEPGTRFESGSLLIIPHEGDWHATADVYRKCFNLAFVKPDGSPDYLTLDDISIKAKDTDFIIRFFAGLDGKLENTYEEMYTKLSERLTAYGIKSGENPHCTVWIAGQNEKGYAFDVPAMFPSFPPSGGNEGLAVFMERMHDIGCTTFQYEHPFATDPDGKYYIKESDPLQHTEYWNLCNHHSICIDNDAVQSLWRDTLLKEFRQYNVDALQFDQGSLQQTVCDLPGHNHGLDSMSRLTSHIKAIDELAILVREGLPEGAFINSEGSSDMLTRYMDIKGGGWYRPQLFGGKTNMYMRQYTFPEFLIQYDSVKYLSQNVFMQSALYGAIAGGIVTLNESTSIEMGAEFVRFRREIRDANAPGFPFGFRDNVGLSISDDKLEAKVFVSEDALTVTYCTGDLAVKDCTITVDPSKLGLKGDIKSISCSLEANKAGFTILKL